MSVDELQEIRIVFQGLQTLYQTYLPKVDPFLIHDLLMRERRKKLLTDTSSSSAPFYLVEISTNEGTDSEKMRDMIYQKTGWLPAIYDNGTRYVTNMRLSLELLKAICTSEEAITNITGDYMGGVTGR
jgi:hypothetical protein